MELLAFIWGGIIAFGVIMYVILGGFDLGIGIMSLFFRDEHERDLMVSAILPVWDGNQTWLVFGGAALYGAFPAAFSAILPIMYIPILIMVLALLFRGVAFEFRLKAKKTKRLWDMCFFFGSLFATLAQGLILGTFVRGFSLTSPHIEQWFNPFGIACAIALIFGYVLLGANYLIIKTEGKLQKTCFKLASIVQYVILAGFIMVSIWSPLLGTFIKNRWFDPLLMPYLAILPILTVFLFLLHRYALKKKYEYIPFWAAIGMFIMCYVGFMISCYPYIVPRELTLIDAAAGESSLLFMLIGACVMLPPLLYYTYYSYRLFRGKVTEKLGY